FDGGDFKTWRRRLRKKIAELTGFEAMPKPNERCKLNTQTLWTREHKFGRLEKIAFRAEPGADVVGYVCLPKKASPPYHWFICVQGHSTGMHNSIAVDLKTNRKTIQIPGDRDFGLGCMKRGIAALCIEQRAFGEREEAEIKHRAPRRCHDAVMHALMLGRTLLGERVFDVDRAIDYLMTRDDVNPKTIGVMGNSGGGTTSLFSAALLDRLQLCMPSGYFCTFRDSIMAMYHCECNYVPNLLQFAEMADVMGLFAPRPVVIVNGKTDPIFPLHAARSEFRRLKKMYRAAGAAEHCHHVIGGGGHRFYAKPAWDAMWREIRKLA
ncbi:MAG: acetylxylan esterase, partial [Phycisphaerae bacterium]|nr:acetylxylan esterase [Phycisphaerae bacterium]